MPIRLYAGLPIAQLSFMALDAPALRPYGHEALGSHYQGQVEATESRYGGAVSARACKRGAPVCVGAWRSLGRARGIA